MRFNFRLKIKELTIFFMFAKTQTLNGITSLVDYCEGKANHVPMWDLERCTLKEAEETLKDVQQRYGLSHIYILNDGVANSFRAICFSIIDFTTLLKILIDTKYLDYSFFYYTVKRQKATIRLDTKEGRLDQYVIDTLHSYFMPIPTRLEIARYDTGFSKRGMSVILGETDDRLRRVQ